MAQSPEATRELVVRARAGSRASFEKLVRRHAGLVAAVATAHFSDRGEVDDLVQEAFMVAWRELAQLRRPESFGYWVSAIARNLARTASAERSRRDGLRLADRRHDQEEAPGREALYRRALAEVERLPDGYREVFLLRYVGEMSCARISEELNLPVGTVTARLSRGHAMLRDKLRGEA